MKYGVLFLIIGVVLLLQGVINGGLYWILLWPGVSFALVASGYLWIGPRVFGKRSDGTMAWYAIASLLPYLLLTWVTWHLVRLTTKEDCFNEVAPGLFVGRRPCGNEIPSNVTLIVDLTAEFTECKSVRAGREYLMFPMLDTGIANADSFQQLVRRVADWSMPVYIHCAQGHGRSGTLAAAVMIARGHATTVDEAVERLRAARPQLDIGRNQREFLRLHVCGSEIRG